MVKQEKKINYLQIRTRGPDPTPTPLLGKSQVAMGFLRNTGSDPSREAIEPFLKGGHLKYADDWKIISCYILL